MNEPNMEIPVAGPSEFTCYCAAPDEALNLRERYPVSKRAFLPYLLAGALTLAIAGLLFRYLHYFEYGPDEKTLLLIALAALGACVSGGIMRAAQCIRLYYAIEDGNLVIAKGWILRRRGSFPLSRITDIYIEQRLSDIILGLYTLRVMTPSSSSSKFARIDWLNADSAKHLERFLCSLIERSDGAQPREAVTVH